MALQDFVIAIGEERLWLSIKHRLQKMQRAKAVIQKDATPLGKQRLHYFWLNKGPWSDLDGHTAFLPGVPERKPLGANFYPEDITKEEFEGWVKALPKQQRDQAEGFFSVIRRNGKQLTVVPYSQAYAADLKKAAKFVRSQFHPTRRRDFVGAGQVLGLCLMKGNSNRDRQDEQD